LNELTDEEALSLLYNWEFWARENQISPSGDWFVWLLRSGRGFGKTRAGAEWVIKRVNQGFKKIALVGQTKADVRDTMIELGESSILKISPPWNMPSYESSKRRVTWPNGAVATAFSGDEPDQLRGPGHDTAWVDELAKFKYAEETWSNLMFGLREGPNPRVCVTTTPRPIKIIKELLKNPRTVDVRGSSYDNIENLSFDYQEMVLKKYEGTRLGRQEIEGEILDDNPDALWSRGLLEKNRVVRHPPLVRIAVAIDPEATANEESAETGIVAAGLGSDGHGYVLEDASLRASPQKWGNAAATLYYKLSADRIVGEVNNGGDMVEHVIRTVDKKIPFKKVWASRGKLIRAEPVSALYEQGRVHHVGMFAELEDQLCEWVPGAKSPDRLDALVWAITELMIDTRKKGGVWGR